MPLLSARNLQRLFLILLCALLIGCESGSDEATVDLGRRGASAVSDPSTPPPLAKTGSLTFQLIRAQAALAVPDQTTNFRFDIYTAPNLEGTILQTQSRSFSNTIVLSDVPIRAKSVLLTALNAEGTPILTARANFVVPSGSNVVVQLERFDEVAVEELLISPATAEVTVGGTRQFTATIRLSDNTIAPASGVVWSIEGDAAITAAGLVTGYGEGVAIIHVQLGDLKGTAAVTIRPAQPVPPAPINLATLSLPTETLALLVGDARTLTAIGTFSDQSNRTLDSAQDGLIYHSSNATVATVDIAGEVKALMAGETTITATVGSFNDSTLVRVVAPNQAPIVTLGGETRIVQGSPSALAIPEALVTDDQPTLSGGTLEVQIEYAGLRDIAVEYAFPAAASLGTVTQPTNTSTRVLLSSAATPAEIQMALRGITLRAIGASGDIQLYIKLSDGLGLSSETTKRFYVEGTTPLTLTVQPTVPISATNFHDIQPAIERVIVNGAPGSVITVAAGNFLTGSPAQAGDALYYLGEGRNLRDLSLRGANFGKSSGITPELRGSETVVRGFAFQSCHNIVVDGFQVQPTTSLQASYGYRADYTFTNTRFVFGGSSYWNYNQNNVSVTFEDCSFDGPATVAEELYAEAFACTGCAFRGSYGPFIYDTPKITMTGNGFSGANTGFGASYEGYIGKPEDVEVHFNGNDVTSNSRMEILGPIDIDATGNWWGQASGPLANQIGKNGTGQAIFTPFLTQDPFPSFP